MASLNYLLFIEVRCSVQDFYIYLGNKPTIDLASSTVTIFFKYGVG